MNSLMGAGVSRNDQNALEYLQRSAELGYPPAQVPLEYFYDTGSVVSQKVKLPTGTRKQTNRTTAWLIWLLGRLYYNGSGVSRDLNAAESWLPKAANQGDPFAQPILGLIRLERNAYLKAAEWFHKAAMQGLSQAQAQLAERLKRGQV